MLLLCLFVSIAIALAPALNTYTISPSQIEIITTTANEIEITFEDFQSILAAPVLIVVYTIKLKGGSCNNSWSWTLRLHLWPTFMLQEDDVAL